MKVADKALALTFLFFVLEGCMLLSLSPIAEGSSGFQIDLFCQYGGRGHDVPCPIPIVVGSRIILYAYVTYDQEPVQSVLVSFQVDNPQKVALLIAVSVTNASGYATTNFTISEHSYNAFPSLWNSTATTSPAQETVSDSMPFEVVLSYKPVGGISLSIPLEGANIGVVIVCVEIIVVALVLAVPARFRKRARWARNSSNAISVGKY